VLLSLIDIKFGLSAVLCKKWYQVISSST